MPQHVADLPNVRCAFAALQRAVLNSTLSGLNAARVLLVRGDSLLHVSPVQTLPLTASRT